ncbi:MAG: hypothetical protein OHK0046_08600 [Anaerolineae bacterium]
MPDQILPHLVELSAQITGIVSRYCTMLDDEFLFGAAMQVPQVATIFDRVNSHRLNFRDEHLRLAELLTLIAYRYGLEAVRVMGHGGYALVLGHSGAPTLPDAQRRVLRLVPEHHVRNIIATTTPTYEFDVRLDADHEPIRHAQYPLILSDLFLMPRHTTKLVFYSPDGQVVQAGGYPASLHCQLLPEVRAFNSPLLDQRLAREAGDLLEAALATLGVSVADAHGGNGGALIGADGNPIVERRALPNGEIREFYVPVVLDYGYYARIGARTLASILVRYGVTEEMVRACLKIHAPDYVMPQQTPWLDCLSTLIEDSGLPRTTFGRLLYNTEHTWIDPTIWINLAEDQWRTTKEKMYPPLQAQSRLSRLYPDYDEVLFPQRIEEYTFTL